MENDNAKAPAPQGLPTFALELLEAQYGAAEAGRIVEGMAAERPVTLRANTLKASAGEVAYALDAAGIAHCGVPWSPEAFVLEGVRERAVWDLPIYEEGKVYLQSLSSMIPPVVLGAQPGEDVLDMTAAPGGKTTQICALTGGRAHVTACEMHHPRAEKLVHNLEKQGATGVNVMRVDARMLDDFFSFDRILLDAPCSGSGTAYLFDPRLAERLTPALVQKSQRAQRALLAKALKLLKPGQTMVYSTCSLFACENEEIVRGALRGGPYEVVPIEVLGGVPIAETGVPLLPSSLPGALCVRPTELYEGFFVCSIRKRA